MPLPTVDNVSLYLIEAQFNQPSVFLEFKYQSMEVTVDVSPAIRYHNTQDCFREKDFAGPAFAELVLSLKSLLFVGKAHHWFKVTVTEAEVEYIQRVMKPEHKTIYIFLKYIARFYKSAGISLTFSSYMMKTVCIHHDIKCEKEGSIKECFQSVINHLKFFTQEQYFASIVNKHINIEVECPVMKTKVDRETLLQGLTTISQLPTDIETVEAFETFLMQILKNESQKRFKAEQDEDKKVAERKERTRAELIEWVSEFVDIGFEPREVKRVLESTLYDLELARKILLQRRANMSKEQKYKVNDSCSSSHGVPMQQFHTHYDRNEWFKHGYSEERDRDLAIKEKVSREKEESSRKILALLPPKPKEEVTYEILYQRQKNI